MQKFTPLILLLSAAFVVNCGSPAPKEDTVMKKNLPTPPVAKKIEKKLTLHGHTRTDDYFWLRERENPDVLAYLTAENDYLKSALGHTDTLQEKLFKEITGRIKKNDTSVPYKENGYYYYTRFEEKKEYPVYCRKKGDMDGREEILLDVNDMAKGHNYYHVAGLAVSPDNKILAFGVDTVSRRRYDIYFKDLEKGTLLGDKMTNTTGRAVWAGDNATVFYTVKDDTLRAYKVLRHHLGEQAAQDKEIFVESDNTFSTGVYKTRSKKYLMVYSNSTLSTEYRFLDASRPDGDFTLVQPREKDLEYHVAHHGDKFYIRTNLDAQNFRLMQTAVTAPGKDDWQEVIPHRQDVLLNGCHVFADHMVLEERKQGLIQFRIVNWAGGEHYLDFGEETYAAFVAHNPEFDSSLLRFAYTSLTTPNSTYDYDMKTRAKKLLKREEILGGFDSANYLSERLYATAKDGVKVPISLVYKKGFTRNGESPLLLNGYGSYGIDSNPYFSSSRLSLLDRGFVFAIAHIRGGQEMGRQWYLDGKLLKKKNTFTDFVACAEHLVKEKYTRPEKLFARGGSAGGLLVGAVANMRPDLFKGIVAHVPWVDVVTTMLDESIPLTTAEYDEWGNPNNKEYYHYMLSYSPYDNVAAKAYPAMLVTAGLHDSQVQYWEPAKWVAKLRALKTDHNLLLLHTNMDAGHGGVSGRFRRFRETALEFAFMLDQLGIEN